MTAYKRLRLALGLTLGVALALCRPQEARAQRYAVVIGNNAGSRQQRALEYAERDASRVADVLTSVGKVRPDRMVLVQGAAAQSARQALIATNQRIRDEPSPPALLVVYYSGHSDAEALQLGDSRLPMTELEGLVRGSAARVRVLIVDSCRSGVLTAGKGGRPAPALRVQLTGTTGDGVVVLTASAAGEDAHESPDLGGSFFTHHLLSGLLGAADSDGDGRVTVTESYDYAYANTLRDSSATLAGPQHPSYRYDLRGQGDVVLTELKDSAARAQLAIPRGLDVLVMRGSATGAMIAEARTPDDSPGTLSLPAGRFFVRVRTARALFEKTLTLLPGQTARLATEEMDRIEFTRLARKGGTHVPTVTGLGLSAFTHRGISDGLAYCSGAAVHAAFVSRSLSLAPRLGACRETFHTERAESVTTELQAAVALNVHRDLTRALSMYLGPELGASYFRQRVTPTGQPRAFRNVFGGAVAVQAGVELHLGRGLTVSARALAQTYLVELENPTRDVPEIAAAFAWGGSLGIIQYFH